MRLAPLLLAAALAGPAAAETQVFEMRLAGSAIGTLTYESTEAGSSWATLLDNTPLGVADGLYSTASAPITLPSGEPARRFEGRSGDRVVEVIHAGGRALATAVTPAEEITDLSYAERVPAGIIDPVEAFERLLSAEGCPGPLLVYDGRRLVALTPAESREDGATLVCEMDYRVAAGPRHLQPLGIAALAVTLTYDRVADGLELLREMEVRSGPFRLRVLR